MPNISAINASIYTGLDFLEAPVTTTLRQQAPYEWAALFEEVTDTAGTGTLNQVTATADARAFGQIREFPNLGIPANVVNVPQYGQATSSQVSGQSDAPSLDFVFNYVPTIHAFINDLRSEGTQRLMRVRLAASEGIRATDGGTNASGGTDGAGANGVTLPYFDSVDGMREFSDFYFFGSVASFEIVPALDDAMQLNITLTIDGNLFGPVSYASAYTAAAVPADVSDYGTPLEIGE